VLSTRGSVTSEARTNTLIIKDTKQGIDSAIDLITRLDTPIPQVLIEARIVEASTSFARDLGIQWGADYQASGGEYNTDAFGASTTSGQTPPATGTAPAFATRHGAGSYAVDLPAAGTAGTLGALGFVLGRAGSNPLILDLRLSAGESEGRLRTISRPRIITMDNKEAKIEQGESIPFETTSAAGTVTKFIDANLSLTVTPHITPDGSVLMKIKASRNSIGTFRSASGEPSINKKETSTEVLVRDGETTVIGGIIVSDTSDTEKGIPLLKDIPLLGWLFKSKSLSDSQTELLIFITPTILKDKVVG
jgi:type IV pilus assembly protein PilQ